MNHESGGDVEKLILNGREVLNPFTTETDLSFLILPCDPNSWGWGSRGGGGCDWVLPLFVSILL